MPADTGRFASHGGPPAERGSTVPLSAEGGKVEMKDLNGFAFKQSEHAIYRTTASVQANQFLINISSLLKKNNNNVNGDNLL